MVGVDGLALVQVASARLAPSVEPCDVGTQADDNGKDSVVCASELPERSRCCSCRARRLLYLRRGPVHRLAVHHLWRHGPKVMHSCKIRIASVSLPPAHARAQPNDVAQTARTAAAAARALTSARQATSHPARPATGWATSTHSPANVSATRHVC